MTELPLQLELLEDDLVRAAGQRVRQLRRRRRAFQAGLAAMLALALAGAGLAASGVLQDWLAGGDPSSGARFSVDPDARYDGPAPRWLGCTDVAGAEFGCREGRGAAREYGLLTRVEAPAKMTRDALLARVGALEERGELAGPRAQAIREAVGAVEDDFFAVLGVLERVHTVGFGFGDERGELVPPPGVPLLVTCRAASRGFDCSPLAGAEDVPVGAPLYVLSPGPDWRVRQNPSADPGNHEDLLFESLLGRRPDAAELRLLALLVTPARTSGSAEATTETAP